MKVCKCFASGSCKDIKTEKAISTIATEKKNSTFSGTVTPTFNKCIILLRRNLHDLCGDFVREPVFSRLSDATYRKIILNSTIRPRNCCGHVKSTRGRELQKSHDNPTFQIRKFFLSTTVITLAESIFAVLHFISLYIALAHGGVLLHVEKGRKKNEFGRIARANDPRTIVSPMRRPAVAYSIDNSYFREPLTILSISTSGKFRANK